MTAIATTTTVRVITDGGELVSQREYADRHEAWRAFTVEIAALPATGEIAQLIEGDLVTAEYNPEFHR